MKVKLQENYKDIYTISDLERAKHLISMEKDDLMTVKEYARLAASEALRDSGDFVDEILTAEATTSMNRDAWNRYDSESGNMDIWIEFIASTLKGFIRGGAFLSDIWEEGIYRGRMWTRYYTEA